MDAFISENVQQSVLAPAPEDEALRTVVVCGLERWKQDGGGIARSLVEKSALSSARDVTTRAARGKPMKRELVQDWMTRDAVTISFDASVADAHKIMREKKVRRLPVLQHGKLVGIVTLGDVRGAEPSQASTLSVWEMHKLLADLKVEKIMTPQPLTVAQDTTIGQAARLMLERKVSGLPVVDEKGYLVGIITESDIFRLVVQEWGKADT
jgi:CBS domain-containing protein